MKVLKKKSLEVPDCTLSVYLSSQLENTLLHHLPGSKKNVNYWYWLALLLALTFLDFRFTIPPTVDKMSSNKFDALGSDDSEGEGDPGQTLVEVD